MVMCQNCCHLVAPSTVAASYMSVRDALQSG